MNKNPTYAIYMPPSYSVIVYYIYNMLSNEENVRFLQKRSLEPFLLTDGMARKDN